MKYLIQLKDSREYVAPAMSPEHYTTDPKSARQYVTLGLAEMCALDNEIVVPLPDALKR